MAKPSLLIAVVLLAGLSAADPGATAGKAKGASEVASGPGAVPADFARDPFEYYLDQRTGEAERYANVVLADASSKPDLRENVLVTMASIHVAQGRIGQASEAFRQILAADPTADLDPTDRLPMPVVRLFYRMRDSALTASTASGKLGPDIRTLAVGDIENNSIVKGRFDLDHFCRGLSQILMTDLQGATPLKVVDRQRLAVLREEIGMSKDGGFVDPANRVRFGQLSGAQSYLFGQLMQLDGNRVRLDIRWVNTSTGEVLLAEAAEGSLASAADLFKLERKVLLELLAPKIGQMLEGQSKEELQKSMQDYLDRKRKTLPSRTDYAGLIEARGRAMANEQGENYAAAAADWAKVAKMDPSDTQAATRARSLESYRKLRRS